MALTFETVASKPRPETFAAMDEAEPKNQAKLLEKQVFHF